VNPLDLLINLVLGFASLVLKYGFLVYIILLILSLFGAPQNKPKVLLWSAYVAFAIAASTAVAVLYTNTFDLFPLLMIGLWGFIGWMNYSQAKRYGL